MDRRDWHEKLRQEPRRIAWSDKRSQKGRRNPEKELSRREGADTQQERLREEEEKEKRRKEALGGVALSQR